MAIVTFTYLLDIEPFRNVIEPVIEKLKQSDPEPLQTLAQRIGTNKPEIWGLLENHRLYPSDLYIADAADEDSPSQRKKFTLWIMTVLASFWVPIATPYRSTNFKQRLVESGWTESELEQLFLGKPQLTLVQPELSNSEIASRNRIDDWPEWCRFGQLPRLTGWLNVEDIGQLLNKLTVSNNVILQVADEQLVLEYNSWITWLTTAYGANRGLFIAVTD